MLPVSELPFLVEQRVCGAEISHLPCLASGHNSNLTSEDMDNLRRQGISVNDDIDPDPENMPVSRNIHLSQLEEYNSWISEGIICLKKSNNIHNTNSAFKNYSRENLMKMKKLEPF